MKIVTKRQISVFLPWIEAVITLLKRFYDLSVSLNALSKSKIVKFVKIMAQTFFELWEYVRFHRCSCCYNRKKNHSPTHLTLFTNFYDLSVSCNLFFKVETRHFGASGRRAYETVGNRYIKMYPQIFFKRHFFWFWNKLNNDYGLHSSLCRKSIKLDLSEAARFPKPERCGADFETRSRKGQKQTLYSKRFYWDWAYE